MTFREELEVFLKKHGMEYAERDLDRVGEALIIRLEGPLSNGPAVCSPL